MARNLDVSLETGSLGTGQWLAILLALATGVVHVSAGLVEGRPPVSLAGVGFFGAIVLFLLDYRRPLLYLLGIGYTAIQIPLWWVANAGEYTVIGYVDKGIQITLVACLVYLYWSERRTTPPDHNSPAT